MRQVFEFFEVSAMSSHNTEPAQQPADAVEAIVHSMPIVLPVVGGVLMFLLAFIAIYIA
jgi:hypothetical protein